MFAHLHVHSQFSPGWGIHAPEALCAAARAQGCTALALTDRNGLYGIPHFLEAARAAGLAPLIGAEAVHGGRRAVLLARDQEGYANLCRLLSDLHSCPGFDLATALPGRRRGLAVLSDDPAVLAGLRRAGHPDLYVELSPGHGMHRALALSRELRLPPVATSRAVLLTPEDLAVHRVLRAIALNTTLDRLAPEQTAAESDLLLSPQRLAEHFPHCPQALDNAGQLVADCKSDWDFSATIFPAFHGLADGEAVAVLEERARAGAERRFGHCTGAVAARLERELAMIRSKGFGHYFLVVEELAARSPRTCGRGSAAASLVAYCLGITHVDPLRHNLFFERFLNPGRVDPPDIDIDFPWDERDAILDFAFARYGAQRAAMVANQVGFGGRAALREVAKVFGVPAAEIKAMTARLSSSWRGERLAAALDRHPLFAGEELSADWRQIVALAGRLDRQLRHLALHCGGLVIVPDELRRYVPVEVSAKGLPVIQWEKDQAEAAGLVKIDILGNRSLAVIRDALAAVAANTGRHLDYAAWQPLADPATRALLHAGATMGCFYIESPATRQLLRRMWGEAGGAPQQPEVIFEQLVMASSIIRPAANAYIREFVARLRGKPWCCAHPLLEPVLGETFGIAIYQEQITRMAMSLAGFSAFDGDQLRKIVSKKHKAKRLEDYRRRFFAGGAERGVPGPVLEECWGQILSFAGYSFCKPHSASYALVSCKSAWLKANYPAEFLAAVISNQGGFYAPFAYLSEARRLGLEVLPVEVNASAWHYTGEGRRLRVGLMQVQGLPRATAAALVTEREQNGPYRSCRELLERLPLEPAVARLLIRAGAFDALEGRARRPALVWEVLARQQRGQGGASPGLFDAPAAALPVPSGHDPATLLRQELAALGLLLSCHPLDLYRRALQRLRPVPAAQLAAWVGRYVAVAGWWVTGKTVRTRQGQPMEFITFEDTTASFDTTFFPRAYARFCRKLSRQRPYLLKGRVEMEFGVATLSVEWLEFLDGRAAAGSGGSGGGSASAGRNYLEWSTM